MVFCEEIVWFKILYCTTKPVGYLSFKSAFQTELCFMFSNTPASLWGKANISMVRKLFIYLSYLYPSTQLYMWNKGTQTCDISLSLLVIGFSHSFVIQYLLWQLIAKEAGKLLQNNDCRLGTGTVWLSLQSTHSLPSGELFWFSVTIVRLLHGKQIVEKSLFAFS